MWVRSLSQEDLEGNGNPLQYSCLENPMDRQPVGSESDTAKRLNTHV